MPDEILKESEVLTRFSTMIHESSNRVAILEENLESARIDLGAAKLQLEKEQGTNFTLNQTIKDLQARVSFLETELAKYKPDPIPLNIPKVTVSLSLDGEIKTYNLTGPGEKRKSSLRWYKKLTDKVGIWVYLRKTEIRVSVGQCFKTLIDPKLAPAPIQNVQPIFSHINIWIDDKQVYGRDIVLHPHGRHPMRFRPLPPPSVDLDKFSDLNLIPHYLTAETTPSAKDLQLIRERRWPWAHFAPVNSAGVPLELDPFSEIYGLNSGSWTGGIPSMDGTEGATVSKSDLFAARSNDLIAWNNVFVTADGMGNFPIHYMDPETGDPIWPEDTLSLEQPNGAALLVADNIQPRLRLGGKSDGVALPLCDTAHMPSFVYFAALVTDDAYLEELQQSWALLGVLCKTRDNGRLWGSVASGQVRAWVWGIRCILHLYLLAEGERKEKARAWLVRVIRSFNEENATPGAKFFRPDCLFGTMKPKSSAGANTFFRFIRSPEQLTTTMWWLGPFSHIMHQCLRAGISEAEQALNYSLGIQRGWWESVRSPFLAPWPNIGIAASGLWADHEKVTFELATEATLPTMLPDGFYTGTYRSACVAASDMGQQWGKDATAFIDTTLAKAGRVLPPTWALMNLL